MTALAIGGGTPVRTDPFPPENTIGVEEKRAVTEVLDSGVLSGFLGTWGAGFLGGPRVRACEAAFADRFGARHAVAVNSATTGLQVALAAAGVGPGDEVIVPAFTMSATAATVVAQGAVPVFADLEDQTYCLDPASVAERITPRTKAISVVHLYGHPARMDDLLALADRHGIVIVEDAAQAIGATDRGRYTGTMGIAGVLSLNRHKIIHCGEGGIVLTNDDRAALVAQLVRNHGETVVEDAGIEDIVNTVGSNFRMTEIEAAIATEQLRKLDALLEHRRTLGARLSARLAEVPGLSPPLVREGCTHSFYMFAVRFHSDGLKGLSRARFADAVRAEGVPVREGYVEPLYWQPLYQRRLATAGGEPWSGTRWDGEVSYERGLCPTVERLHHDELLLLDVCRTPLDERDIDDVADAFEKVVSGADELAEIVA